MTNIKPTAFAAVLIAGVAACEGDVAPPSSAKTLGELFDEVRASTSADTDGDRLPDDVEADLGTDPSRPDSDRDGEFDYYELFGYGELDRLAPIPDGDGDDLISPLDDDDDGDGLHDGEGVDTDGDGIANYEEYYGYLYDPATGTYEPWDGEDYTVRYFKSDPNQASTDQDPYGDAMEASATNMDVSVRTPGNYPMVPAFADIVVRLEGYAVALNTDITYSEGGSLEEATTWERTVEATHQTTDEFNWGVEASVGFGKEGFSANFSASFGGSHSTMRGTSTSVATGSSITSEENWSRSFASNPTEAAHIKLFLRITNHGTAIASNVVPTLTLRIGGHNVATFRPGNAPVSVLEPGATYPSMPGVYWVVDSVDSDSSTPLALTLNELRALESGAPVSITVTQMSADVMQREAGTGAYESVGDWNQYLARIEPVSADLYFDIGDGNFVHSLVYAGGTPLAPLVTLGDALVWAAGARFSPDGTDLTIGYRNPDAPYETRVSLDGWHFALDSETYRRNGFDPEVPLPAETDAWELRIFPDSTIVAKPPRELLPDAENSFAVHYAFFDQSLGTVNVVTTDYRGIRSVQFVDKDGVPSVMREVVPGSSFYSYNPNADPIKYPDGYLYDHSERIVVTNLDGDTLTVELESIYLPADIVPRSPEIRNVRLDLVNAYVYADVVPDPAFPPAWVRTFYRPNAYSLVRDVEMEPSLTWYAGDAGYQAAIDCDFVVGDSRVVAYVQPGVFAERPITDADATHVRSPLATAELEAHHDWTATDYYRITGLDFDTGRTTTIEREEGDWNPAWNPSSEYETWLRWVNIVAWKFFWNRPAKRITNDIDPACLATAEPLACIELSSINRCDLATEELTFGDGDYFLVQTDRDAYVIFRVGNIRSSSSGAGNWRQQNVTISYRLYANVEAEVVSIHRASYNTETRLFTVQATSNVLPAGTAVIEARVGAVTLGELAYEPFLGIYRASFTLDAAPASVTVDSGTARSSAGVVLTSERLTVVSTGTAYNDDADAATIELTTDHVRPGSLTMTAWLERGGHIVASTGLRQLEENRFQAVFTHIYEAPDAIVVESAGGGELRYEFP